MKTKLLIALIALCAGLIAFSAGLAEAAVGTLAFTFKYKNPATGVDQNLTSAWVYLRDASKPPPMEKFFSRPDLIVTGSFGNGSYLVSNIPAGTYYVRVTQRKILSGGEYWLGPPREGDYTWMRPAPITIVSGSSLNLGTLYAQPFSLSPITITGTVKSPAGAPLAGRYVRAQTEPCYTDGYNSNVNECGPTKSLSLQQTDASGKYTLRLRDPGTYYIYSSPCITADYYPYGGNRCGFTAAPGPVTVKIGDSITVDMVAY